MSDQSFQAALAERPGESGLRQAAALIHALSPADRRWAIAQLPAHQREAVEGLLAELTAMGLPRDRAIVDAALHREPVGASMHTVATATTASGQRAPAAPQAIGSASAGMSTTEGAHDAGPRSDAIAAIDRWLAAQGAPALAKLVTGEPVPLVARLLTVHDWSWRAEALRHLQPALRQDVVEAMRLRADGDAASTAADAVLLDLFAQRLDAVHPVPATASASTSGAEGSAHVSALGRLLSRWRAARSAG